MKIDLRSRWLNALIIGGCFALVGVGVFYLHEEAYYDFRRDFRQIPPNTFLAECTDKNYPATIYGDSTASSTKYWLVGEKSADENEVSIFPLVKDWEFSSLFAPFEGSPRKWRPVSQLQLQKEWGVGSDQYRTIFADETLKCEAMLRDVNHNGSLDIVLRKSQTLKGEYSQESATNVYVCAYGIVDGRVQFFEP